MKERTMNGLMLMTILALLVIDSALELKTQDKQQEYYCEMVELFETSEGDNGHPDYRQQYNEVCNND